MKCECKMHEKQLLKTLVLRKKVNGQCKKGEEKWRVYAEGLKGMLDGQGEERNVGLLLATVLPWLFWKEVGKV